MEKLVYIDRLEELLGNSITWNEEPVTLEDVDNRINSGDTEENEIFTDTMHVAPIKNNQWHIKRVIYFVNHPEEIKDIEIDNMCYDGYILPVPIILDGNHRYMAALHLKNKGLLSKVSCSYGGREDLLDYLIGKTDICPSSWD